MKPCGAVGARTVPAEGYVLARLYEERYGPYSALEAEAWPCPLVRLDRERAT